VPGFLPKPPDGRTLVLAAGKAAASMALAVEQHWPADKKLVGIALTRYGHALPLERVRWVEAGHPVPDEAGETAAREMLAAARAIKPMDMMLALLSGGGSALLSLPVDGVTIADLRAVTRDLLKSGAAIQEINTVRKHLSQIQGGRLAAACKAPVHALIISDVTGDNATHIASGPCSADPTTYQDAVEILNRFDIKPPQAVLKHLIAGLRGEKDETPKPGADVFRNVRTHVIATSRGSMLAAAKLFQENGITPVILGDSISGEAREVAKVMAALVREIREHGTPFKPPVALL
jgi:hydroxypyruvate reductase